MVDYLVHPVHIESHLLLPSPPGGKPWCCKANGSHVSQSSCIVSGEIWQATCDGRAKGAIGNVGLVASSRRWDGSRKQEPSAPLPEPQKPISRPCAPAALCCSRSGSRGSGWPHPAQLIVAAEDAVIGPGNSLRSCQFPSALASESQQHCPGIGRFGGVAFLAACDATAAFSNRSIDPSRNLRSRISTSLGTRTRVTLAVHLQSELARDHWTR